jgi:hypothetical protein
MKWLCVAIAAAHSPVVHGDAQPKQIVKIPGSCVVAQLAGNSVTCATNTGVIFVVLSNGVAMFNIPLADDRVLAFVGERDAQPAPGEYALYLQRVRLGLNAQESAATDVTGTCKMSMTPDGSMVHRIVCNASDISGRQFLLDFRGNDQPVEMITP